MLKPLCCILLIHSIAFENEWRVAQLCSCETDVGEASSSVVFGPCQGQAFSTVAVQDFLGWTVCMPHADCSLYSCCFQSRTVQHTPEAFNLLEGVISNICHTLHSTLFLFCTAASYGAKLRIRRLSTAGKYNHHLRQKGDPCPFLEVPWQSLLTVPLPHCY